MNDETPGEPPQWPGYQPPPPAAPYGSPQDAETPVVAVVGGTGGAWRGIVLAAVVALAGMVVAFLVFKGVDTVKEAVANPQLHTQDGFAELLTDLEEKTGRTEVFRVVLYPDYASLDVPAEARGKRSVSYYYDGSFRENTKSTTDQGRLDLRDVDITVALALLEQMRSLVDEPTSSYLIIEGPGMFDQVPTISAYATNEFGEGGYIAADLTGKEIRRSLH